MRLLLLALALFAASPALALSCLKPSPVRSYLEANASEDRWGAVVGRLHFDDSRLPDSVGQDGRKNVELRGQLVGESLGPDGFEKPFQGGITLRVVCTGSWCGQAKSGGYYLVFVKREGARHYAIADPCESWLFENPSPRTLNRLERCYRGGYCDPADDDD